MGTPSWDPGSPLRPDRWSAGVDPKRDTPPPPGIAASSARSMLQLIEKELFNSVEVGIKGEEKREGQRELGCKMDSDETGVSRRPPNSNVVSTN